MLNKLFVVNRYGFLIWRSKLEVKKEKKTLHKNLNGTA